jgi:hypothetical protein
MIGARLFPDPHNNCPFAAIVSIGKDGIINVTADIQFSGIFRDTHVPKYKELADRWSNVLPIYWGFSQ